MKNYIPFSNRAEYTSWQERNCFECLKYEFESIYSENHLGCKLALSLDLGMHEKGIITEDTVNEIGFTRKETQGETHFCDLCKKCNQFQPVPNT